MPRAARLALMEQEAARIRQHAQEHGWIGEVRPEGGFSTKLSLEDRQRLRAIIRKVQLRWLPAEYLSDRECDRLIDAWGPEVAAAVVRDGRAAGFVD
jgi:hypothetical protein